MLSEIIQQTTSSNHGVTTTTRMGPYVNHMRSLVVKAYQQSDSLMSQTQDVWGGNFANVV